MSEEDFGFYNNKIVLSPLFLALVQDIDNNSSTDTIIEFIIN